MLNITIDFSFIAFRTKEIVELLKKEIFKSIKKDDVSSDVRIFSSRFVNEIKHLDTEKAFEKSRLVMQVFKNQNKIFVLTQSLIIQRVSQRLILCLTIMFSLEIKLYLRNIIQVYVQSATSLNRDFYVQSSSELIKLMRISADCVLKVIKPLYEMFEIENH
jgi:CRISPR/Cas system CMR subunit Cmr6 (Cas7 group RAMP superfamily)